MPPRISADYDKNVFINCPFDDQYTDLFRAAVFTVIDCGFKPRCALEVSNAGETRLDKLYNIIRDCKFGIHDISRTELDAKHRLPRFNMPLELGIFLGAKKYGNGCQKNKCCIVVDMEQYRYQKFISDIAGQDIVAHNNEPDKLIKGLRDWLAPHTEKPLPGGKHIKNRYAEFNSVGLPEICVQLSLEILELQFSDLVHTIVVWCESKNKTNS